MMFASPWLLLLLLPALPVIVYLGYVRRRTKAAVIYSSVEAFRTLKPSMVYRLRRLPDILRCLALALIIVALARPQKGQESVVVSTEGIAIQMVVDVSGSMMAEDMQFGGQRMNRLDALKRVFKDFIAGGEGLGGRPNDVIGMVSFARYPDARCPLTLDHGVLLQLIDDTQIVKERTEDGTAIGEAMALGIDRMKDAKVKSKVMILLTDGQNNCGDAVPVDTQNKVGVARVAKSLGIKIYTIGAGTRGYAPFPVMLPSGETALQRMEVNIDEATLKEIADVTGGRYFRATDGDSLARIYGEIDKLEKTKTESIKYLDYTELFPFFLFPGLGLLVIEHTLRSTRFRKIP